VIKWIVAIKYKADQSKEACRKYWIEEHAPLALELAGLKHYGQSHRVLGEDDFGNAPYDGFGSLWFENEAAAKQALASPQMAALKADANHFADPASTKQFLAREVVLRDVPEKEEALKLVAFNYRKQGLSPRMFQDYWENRHGPLVLRNFAALGRYVQNQAVLSSYAVGAEPDFDGVLEAWLTSIEALRAGDGTPENEAVRADEANFLDPVRFRFMLARERIFR
jgi:uncharacterized protein (TIGR02118 family)